MLTIIGEIMKTKKIRIMSCNVCPQSYYANSLNLRICNDSEMVAKYKDVMLRECPEYNIRTDCPLEDY